MQDNLQCRSYAEVLNIMMEVYTKYRYTHFGECLPSLVPEVATHDGEKVVQVLETAVCSPPQQVGVTSRKGKHAQLGH